MNIKKALEIIDDFKKSGTKGIIKEYPREELKQVLPEIYQIDREADWYKEMLKYLYREKSRIIYRNKANTIKKERKYNILEDFKFGSKPLKYKKKYRCFVIMPIGKKGTIEYENNMAVFNKIIKPCTENSGYNIKCYHADLITASGGISKQVIEALKNDPIVIADLRRNNPNVIYELGIRHAFGKRSILICSAQTEHFFHTTNYRAVEYKIDGASNQEFYNSLSDSIRDIIENQTKSDNPVTDNLGQIFSSVALKKSPKDKKSAEDERKFTHGVPNRAGIGPIMNKFKLD